MHYTLWTLQGLLAALFLFAGVAKFFTPQAQFAPLQPWFVYMIAVFEILGALGLILPGVFKTKTFLTGWAAAGLTVIMIGAVVTSWPMGLMFAALPFVVGIFTGLVAYGRWEGAPTLAK
jgi:uncharacterized membrane protein